MTTQHHIPAPDRAAQARVLVFDFDGTVSLGTGPVLAYARAAAASLTDDDNAARFIGAVEIGLERVPSGQLPGTGAIDGYDLVRLLATSYGVTQDQLADAYLTSRDQLATELAPVVAPRGLAEFLAFARDHATIVLATNAPDIRIADAVAALGLDGLFDAVYTSVGKPDGLARVLDEWMPAGELLSIGDVWVNDLEPAHTRGALTALVGSASSGTESPTYRADHLHDLYPVIAAWLESPLDNTTPAPSTTASSTAPTPSTKGSPRVH